MYTIDGECREAIPAERRKSILLTSCVIGMIPILVGYAFYSAHGGKEFQVEWLEWIARSFIVFAVIAIVFAGTALGLELEYADTWDSEALHAVGIATSLIFIDCAIGIIIALGADTAWSLISFSVFCIAFGFFSKAIKLIEKEDPPLD